MNYALLNAIKIVYNNIINEFMNGTVRASEEMELSLNISEDENCTFITTNLLEQSENFDEWLDKNGVHCIINNGLGNGISDNRNINNPLDPLLNQLNTSEELSDNETGLQELQDEGVAYGGNEMPLTTKFLSLTHKSEYLEQLITNNVIFVLFEILESKINLVMTNAKGDVVFPSIHINLNDIGGQLTIPKDKVSINSMEKFTISNDLKAMMPCLTLETGPKLFICPQEDCTLVYTRFSAAKMHTLTELSDKPFKCTYPGCTWAFYTSFKLRRHQDTHTNSKDFVCAVPNCGRRFTNIYNLNIHVKKHCRPATLPCPVQGCMMKFQTSRSREKHFKSHDVSEAPFACPQPNCKRAFFIMSGLQSHARSHSHKESELRCDYPNCGKIFEQPCRLKEHARSHNGQRPYVCTHENCTWSFTTASKLKRHQSTHTKERKFHCTIGTCNKSFIRSEHLKEHTLTHIGSRTFTCEVCAASFHGRSNLYMHIKKNHPENQHCARSVPFSQGAQEEQPVETKKSSDILLEQATQSLGVPSDMILGTGLIPEEPLELLENGNFSTVNLRDLE